MTGDWVFIREPGTCRTRAGLRPFPLPLQFSPDGVAPMKSHPPTALHQKPLGPWARGQLTYHKAGIQQQLS